MPLLFEIVHQVNSNGVIFGHTTALFRATRAKLRKLSIGSCSQRHTSLSLKNLAP